MLFQASSEALYKDREQAGLHLASKLTEFRGAPDTLVLGLPRGGVPVAFVVATRLRLPLDVFIVRKLGVPGQEELAMGAIASPAILVLNEEIVEHIPQHLIELEIEKETIELRQREQRYLRGRPPVCLCDQRIILVDDGLATGASMRAAIAAIRTRDPAEIIAAVPVAPAEACEEMRKYADRVICARTPGNFRGVGSWYEDFRPTSDGEVLRLLKKSRKEQSAREHGSASAHT